MRLSQMEKKFRVCFKFISLMLVIVIVIPVSMAQQLSASDTRILFQVQKFLEYPQVLQGWSNWTNFCYLPSSPSLKIVCLNNRVSELTITGNKTSKNPKKFSLSDQTLSSKFNIDAFFTTLTKLSSLKVLSLVSLGLWGALPGKINRFQSLEVLNISSNSIYGEIPPQISSFKNLKVVNLNDNLFNGSIIPNLKNLVFLQELNLGGNNFLGPIPSFLFSLPSIQYLNLAQNQLSGAISLNISCGSKLRFIDISHNLLIGKLPSCFGSKSSINRRVVSSWNCLSVKSSSNQQHPYSFCRKEALAVKPPVLKSDHDQEQKSSIKLGLIVGVIGGIVGIVLVFGLLVLVIIRRSETTNKEEEDQRDIYERSIPDKMSVRNSPKQAIDSRRVPQTMRSAAIGLSPYRVFTLEEIEDATNNFDPTTNLIGEGSQGQMYKGCVRDGSIVLVKCIKLKQKHQPQSLMQHMEVLSKLRHRHLVSVLGHCIVTYQDHHPSIVFIVLEHVSKGSLRDYLTDRRKKEMLKWPQRMAIIIGAARGTQFLHTGVAPGIFGNNLKIENILLDDSLTAKLSGYSFPLPSKIGSESPLNSIDDPEKEDVYQLGVILLQVMTGKLINSVSELNQLKLQLEDCLADSPSKLRGEIDPSVRGTYAYDSIRTTVEITINCLSKDSRKRPSIEDVLWNLQYSIQVQEGWTSSGNLSTQV